MEFSKLGLGMWPNSRIEQPSLSWEPGSLPPNVAAAVNGVALCGTLAGQLVFGWLGDKLGRKGAYGQGRSHTRTSVVPGPHSSFDMYPHLLCRIY
ncbi:unnamed protein product [Prunus armeniaca]|uniref:Major facilitator superfamily (MFS) profile domain-containing protein n=1 Tax=Prunus armeniaca TaxID=36596 RepID=A0A6J5TU79_PRUAR|nr:unnamed protein product [Prunus armeniaca]CAB4297457.1 unnamed protein product [Prunus armeniaca]